MPPPASPGGSGELILSGWQVDGFGTLGEWGVSQLRDGLVVVYGPNEAGKSTLLRFLRFALFGPRAAKPLEALHGGRSGGRLFIEDEGRGTWILERHAPGKTFTLRDPGGDVAHDGALRTLLGGADEALFTSIFAFSLDELSRLSSLTDPSVKDQIFSAGITGAGATVSGARKSLEGESQKLLKKRAESARINRLMAEIRDVDAKLKEARRQVASYEALRDEEAREQERARALKEEAEGLRAETETLTVLGRLWSTWKDWRQSVERLGSMPPLHMKETDGGSRMAELRTNLEVARGELEHLEADHRKLEEELRHVSLDPTLEDVAQRAQALEKTAATQRGRLERLEGLKRKQSTLESRLGDRLRAIGPGWTAERLAAFGLDLEVEAEAEEWARKTLEAAEELKQAKDRLEEQAGELAAGKRAVVAVRGRLEGMAAHPTREEVEGWRADLEEMERRIGDLQSRPAWLAVLLALSLGMGVFGVREGGGVGYLTLGAGALAALIVLATMGRGWLAERRNFLALASRIGLSGWPRHEDLGRLRRELLQIEARSREREEIENELRGAEAAADRLESRVDALSGRADAAGEARDRALAAWDDWKKRRSLPEGLGPDEVRSFVAAVRGAKEVAEDLVETRIAAGETAKAAAAWEKEAREVLVLAHWTAPEEGEALTVMIEELGAAAQEAVEGRKRHREISERLKEMASQILTAREELASREEAHQELLDEVGAPDDRAFDAMLDEDAERRGLEKEASLLEKTIADQLGSGEYSERLRERLETEGPAEWEARRAQLAARVRGVEEDRRSAIEAARSAEDRRRALEEAADVAALEGRMGMLLTEREGAVSEWRRLRLAHKMLERTLERFVRERQPDVLRHASEAFLRVTGGRYRQIIYDPLMATGGEQLGVVGERGEHLQAADLSRGTQEQLYLSLRIGLAESFAERAVSLPLVLDDVLVNFDPERAREMMRAFRSYLGRDGRQILLFTCHPETRDMAQREFGDLRLLDLRTRARGTEEVAATAEDRKPLDRARDLLRTEGVLTARRLKEGLGVDAGGARELLRHLVDEGLTRREGVGRGTRYVLI